MDLKTSPLPNEVFKVEIKAVRSSVPRFRAVAAKEAVDVFPLVPVIPIAKGNRKRRWIAAPSPVGCW